MLDVYKETSQTKLSEGTLITIKANTFILLLNLYYLKIEVKDNDIICTRLSMCNKEQHTYGGVIKRTNRRVLTTS